MTRDTGESCRWCGEHVGDVPEGEKFCGDDCEESFSTVMDARLELGKRDIEQRGYD